MMWFGLAESLTNISPNVAAADRPGIYFAPDNNGKIQFISLYSDRTASFIGVPDSTINYGGYNVWRQASLTVNGLNWNIEVKDDNGALLGQMSGTLPKEHAAYDYVMLMFNYGSGWENMTGLLDDVQVSGCPNSQVNVQTIIDNSTVFPNNVSDVSMAVGDLTNDGILDIAITKGAESYGAGAAVFQGSGNTWDTGTLLAGPTKNNAYNPIVAPIRNDGQNWLVFPEHLWGNSGEWLRGNLYSGVGITDHCANTYG